MVKNNSGAALQRDHRAIRGRIRYTSRKPEREGQERGREYFTIVRHADGSRTLTARSEIDDRPSVLRHQQLNLDSQWLPTDAHLRLSVGDRFVGSGWFRFAAGRAECEAFTAAEGRLSQSLELDSPCRGFGGHAVQNDAWTTRLFDLDGPSTQQLPPLLLSSPDHRGATGPYLARVTTDLTFVGREQLQVVAGRFDALHFVFSSVAGMAGEHPTYDVWVTADGEYVLLRAQAHGYMLTHCELEELHTDP